MVNLDEASLAHGKIHQSGEHPKDEDSCICSIPQEFYRSTNLAVLPRHKGHHGAWWQDVDTWHDVKPPSFAGSCLSVCFWRGILSLSSLAVEKESLGKTKHIKAVRSHLEPLRIYWGRATWSVSRALRSCRPSRCLASEGWRDFYISTAGGKNLHVCPLLLLLILFEYDCSTMVKRCFEAVCLLWLVAFAFLLLCFSPCALSGCPGVDGRCGCRRMEWGTGWKRFLNMHQATKDDTVTMNYLFEQ